MTTKQTENTTPEAQKSNPEPVKLVRCRVVADEPIELPTCIAVKGAVIQIPEGDFNRREKSGEVKFIEYVK